MDGIVEQERVLIQPEENALSLFIGVPACRDWKQAFGSATDALTFHLYEHGIGKGKIRKIYKKYFSGASCLPQTRQLILNEALALDAEGKPMYSHLMMIDDDMVFPPDVLAKLISRNLPVVAGNYCRKIQDQIKGTALDMSGQHMDSSGKTGVEQAMYIGLGMCLVRTDAIRHIPRPNFEVLWDEARQDYWGEDMYFCDRLRDYGVPIHVDHDVSNAIGHVGDYVYQFHKEPEARAKLCGTPINQDNAPKPAMDSASLFRLVGEPLAEAAE